MISAKKLIKLAKKWRKYTALQRRRISFNHDGRESCCTSLSVVDKGHFAVYTADHRRFVLPLAYLNNSLFRQLLKMSEEEYGLPSNGPIILPCDSLFMDYAICLIRQGRAGDFQEDFLVRSRCSSSCLVEGQMKQQLLIC
ncbi:Auxin-responsive protein SAUR64 [Sesamum alatum]|uniref:Auxin-responsive protein SAUR64 n=1 Tax=Sesamum alatum TaxID=300844 RepID=A0AAE1Y632_9LAMI|nr:Auxin-responsive protein SAUR64 [Sesamum alatum]